MSIRLTSRIYGINKITIDNLTEGLLLNSVINAVENNSNIKDILNTSSIILTDKELEPEPSQNLNLNHW